MSELSRTVDPRSLMFTPAGLGGPMLPEVARDLFVRECEVLRLPEVVPAGVRSQFAKVLDLYADGVFTYANFTTVPREAHRVLEVALRVRFLEHYAAGVPLVISGTEEIVTFRDFDGLGQRLRDRAVRLRGHPQFNGSFASLLRWARAEGYLYGQRNRVREDALLQIRNHEAHSEFDAIHMPPDAWRALRHVSEMIAQLWGGAIPTRTCYPGTIERIPTVVGQGPRALEGTQFALELLPQVADEDATEPVWYVLLGAVEEELILWRAGTQSTNTPAEHLWGPGSFAELRSAAATQSANWNSDRVMLLDRTFYVRVINGAIDPARSAAQILATRERVDGERWFVLRADSPGDARTHVRRSLSGECRERECGCPATTLLASCTRDAAARHAREAERLDAPEEARA